MLLPQEMIECKGLDQCADSPLARAIFEKFEWVSNVFISNNFITITKKAPEEWYEFMPAVKEYLQMYISHNFEIVSPAFLEARMMERTNHEAADDIESKIKNLLEKYVKPAVEMDGGNIAFRKYEDGVVALSMQGSCSGCPSSQVTLKSGIEGLLKRMIPEIQEVVAEEA